MLSRLAASGTLLGALLFTGCAILEDNGTHLAYALERGAKTLRSSNLNEYVVRYEPLGDPHQTYEITLAHSREVVRLDSFGNVLNQGGGYLTVAGQRSGGTNYHERFVFTPADLHIVKTDGPTEVVLRKVGDHIEVVGLR